MAKYLGQTGLVYLWGKIKTWVGNYVKITSSTGKDTITAGNNSVDIYDWAQASTKPSYNLDEITDGTTNKAFTQTEKTKLGNIASGAEVNQNAFSNVKVGNTTIAADAKTDTLILEAGGDVTLTPDTSGDKVTISVTTPKKTSELNNDSGFITAADVPEGAAASTSTPLMDGTAAVGSETAFARGDHRHPSDTSKQNVINDLEDIREGASAGATAYQKPSGGIPKTDLASAVQNSLGLADSALQSSDITGKADKSATVSTVAYDATNKKITKTINGSTTDVVTAAKIVIDGGGVTDVSGKVDKTTTVNGHALSGNVTVSKSDVGLGNVTNDAQIPLAQKGVANGVCPLDANTKIDAQYLPSYVDDVVEAYIRSGQTALSQSWLATGSATGTVITPQSGVIYVIMNGTDDYPTNSQYRWATNTYVKLNDGGVSELTTAEMDTATNNWA